MDYNTLSYLIYVPITFFIMVYVGWMCYKNGEVFIARIFGSETELVKSINKLLLVGYYLVNLGYATFTLFVWPTRDSLEVTIQLLATKIGIIVVILGILHYLNIFAIAYLGPKYLKTQKI